MSKKRRSAGSSATADMVPDPICIIHSPSLSNPGPFTALDNIKSSPAEKLAYLNNVRDRRLAEPLESPYRMQTECQRLPQSLNEINLQKTGYHRHCYARFTKNLNRLQQPSAHETDSSTDPAKHHSPRKRTSAGEVLFSPECIFCERLEIKSHGATERAHEFPHWNHKDSGWSHIAPMAKEMGNTRLFRLTADVDLHAKSAKYHRSCYVNFCTSHKNFKRSLNQSTQDTDRGRLLAAHQKAYEAVSHYIENNIIDQNQMVQLSSLRAVYIDALEEGGSPNPAFRGEKLLLRIKNDK